MLPSPCTRGCCWSPYGCAKSRTCDCHPATLTGWLGVRAADEVDGATAYRDPVGNQAVNNVMRAKRGRAN